MGDGGGGEWEEVSVSRSQMSNSVSQMTYAGQSTYIGQRYQQRQIATPVKLT